MEKEKFDKAVELQKDINQLEQKICLLKNANMIVLSDDEINNSKYTIFLKDDSIFENARQNKIKMLKFKLEGLKQQFAKL